MKQRPKLRRAGIIVAALVVVYAVFGFLVVPALMRRQIVQKGSAALQRQVSVERVRFNPFTFAVTVEGFAVAAHDGGVFAACEQAMANFDPLESLFRWQWRMGQVKLTAPTAKLIMERNGELNIADLLRGARTKDNRSRPPSAGVDQLVIEGGSIEFTDRSLPETFTTMLHPISFALTDFSTAVDASGSYRLTGKTARGETFAWTGRMEAVPFRSQGRIEFSGVDLPAYQPFLAAYLNGELRSGRLDLAADYEVAFGSDRRELLRDLKLTLSNLALALPNAEEPILRLSLGEIGIPEADAVGRSIHIDHVNLDQLAVKVVRDASGAINLRQFFPVKKTRASSASHASDDSSAKNARPAIRLDHLSLQHGSISVVDHAVDAAAPASMQAKEIKVTLNDLGPDLSKPAGLELSLQLQPGSGTMEANGTFTLQPVGADLQAKASALELAMASPYLRRFAAIQITGGQAQLDGHIEASLSESQTPTLHWTGRLAINDLATRDRKLDQELVQWAHLGIEGSDFTLEPLRLSIRELSLEQPKLTLIRDQQGTLNVIAAFTASSKAEKSTETTTSSSKGSEASQAPAPARAQEDSAAFAITINQVKIEGGDFHFTDRSMDPAAEANITRLEGTLTGLSTEQGSEGKVNLTASVFGTAPLKLTGAANMLGPDVFSGSDLSLDLRGVKLEPLEPYVMHFLGYRIARGKMQGDFEYKLVRGSLDGSNHIVLNNFYLGEAVPSPAALSVPVKLGLALLRDRQGQVVLNVPVSGSLTSPDFNFAEAIQGAVGNVFEKVVTAPFALLGSLFGSGDEDLSQASFAEGDSTLNDGTRSKLQSLAKALQARPGLSLVIHGQTAPDLDRAALRKQRLEELIQQEKMRLAESRESKMVSDTEALRSFYANRVEEPTAVDTGKVGQEPAPAQGETERPAWYVRVWRYLFADSDKSAARESTEAGGPPAPPPPDTGEVAPALEQMRERLLASIPEDAAAVDQLGQSRAERARDYLIDQGIARERLEISAPDRETKSARVNFELQEAGGGSEAPRAVGAEIEEAAW